MKQSLSEKSAAEEKLKERCEQLQGRLVERGVVESEKVEGLQQRVSVVERECSESRMEASQLRAELRSATSEKESIQEQVG